MAAPVRLAVLDLNPMPYRVPLWRKLAANPAVDLLVTYGDSYGVEARAVNTWGTPGFAWAGDLTSGYPNRFLRNLSPRSNLSPWTRRINPGLLPALAGFRPQAILVMGYAGVYQLQGFAAAAALRVPLLYWSDTNIMGEKADWRVQVKRALVPRLFRRVSAFLTIGERNRQHYLAYGVPADRLFPFCMAVDDARFDAWAAELAPRRAELRRRWGVPEGARCALFVGRLRPEKNVGELIRAIGRLDGFHLLVVGSGVKEPELQALAASDAAGRVTFSGFLNQDEVGAAYAAADLFALPSTYEPWGLVCNEAMHFGLPLVVSDQVGAGPELVSPGETGFVYPAGDVDACAQALRRAGELAPGERIRRHVGAFGIDTQERLLVDCLRAVCA